MRIGRFLLAGLLVAAAASGAQAGVRIGVGIGIGFPCYRPYYYAPYPYYYYPAPVVVGAPVVAAPVAVATPTAVVAGSPAPAPAAPVATPAPAPTPVVEGTTTVPPLAPVSGSQDLNALSDPNAQVRAEACIRLGRSKDRQAVSPLVRVLRDDANPATREAAARALGLIGAPSSLAALQNAAQADDDRDVRRSASFAAEVIRSNMRR
jgi:hypothetical protein